MVQQPPYFNASRMAFWNNNRHVYRVYVLPNEMLFLKLGSGFRDPGSAAAMGGAVGGGIAGLMAGRKLKQIEEKRQQLDAAPPEELRRIAREDKGSFSATADELSDLRLDAPSGFWGLMLSGATQTGLLCFTHAKHGKYTLELVAMEDMKKAFDALPQHFGNRIAVNVQWDDRKQKFVKK